MGRGMPSRWAIAAAATASGGETIAPSTNAAGQVQPLDERVGDDGDHDRRGQHAADGEQGDRLQLGAEVTERRVEGGGVEQRRQEEEEDQLRLEREVGQARHEAERQAADDEQRRIRNRQPAGHRDQRQDDDEQTEN